MRVSARPLSFLLKYRVLAALHGGWCVRLRQGRRGGLWTRVSRVSRQVAVTAVLQVPLDDMPATTIDHPPPSLISIWTSPLIVHNTVLLRPAKPRRLVARPTVRLAI